MDKKSRYACIRKNLGIKSTSELARMCGVSVRTIQRDINKLGLTKPSIQDRVSTARTKASTRAKKRTDREALKRIIELEDELNAALKITSSRNYYVLPKPPDVNRYAVAVMVASDWHIEEIVHRWQVNGLNKFNEDICMTRVRRFFHHGLKMIEHEQHRSTIDTLILALLGDFISGSIHEELMEGNRLLPTMAIIEAQEHMASGIRYILDNSELNLIIVCKSGNHGRMTRRIHVSTEAGNSLERFMYHALAQQFADEPRVKFVAGDGYHSYIDIFDNYVVRFHHGHAIRYYGGVGGVSIPMNKAVAQWNKIRHADLDVIGHFHQFLDGGNWLINGSLIGYNAFALSIKASPEEPRQAFFLIDRDEGKTIVAPIILTRDR